YTIFRCSKHSSVDWNGRRRLLENTNRFSSCEVMLPKPSLSCGNRMSLETPYCEAHGGSSHARGKRPPAVEINSSSTHPTQLDFLNYEVDSSTYVIPTFMDNLNGGTKFSRSALVAGRLRWTWLILVTSKIKPFLCFLISEQKRAADQIMMIRCSITLTYHERRLSFVVNGFCSLPFLNHQAVHR